MRFCQSFMTELYRHIGPDTDVPAGDIGVGGREVGYLFGQYKRLQNEYTGVLTGRASPSAAPSPVPRPPATVCATSPRRCWPTPARAFEGHALLISGSGNVATHANQKASQLGGKVIAMSDSNGYIVDENGIDYKVIKEIKEVKRARIKTYLSMSPPPSMSRGSQGIWTSPAISPAHATKNGFLDGAKALVANGCYCVAEGANMPSTPGPSLTCRAGILLPPPGSNAERVAPSGAGDEPEQPAPVLDLRGGSMSACTTSWSTSTRLPPPPPRSTA